MLAGDFERICTLLGIRQREAAEQALKDWVEKNKGQATIDAFLKNGIRPIVFQNVTLIKTQLNIIKTELGSAVEAYERAPEESKFLFLKQIGKILPTAMTLARETRDQELQELIKKVEQTL